MMALTYAEALPSSMPILAQPELSAYHAHGVQGSHPIFRDPTKSSHARHSNTGEDGEKRG